MNRNIILKNLALIQHYYGVIQAVRYQVSCVFIADLYGELKFDPHNALKREELTTRW